MALDLSGQKFGHLTALERVKTSAKWVAVWKCRCDCGNITNVRCGNLRSGAVKSCGCLLHRPATNRTHGMRKTRLYREWTGMKVRCNCKTSKSYKIYGARGIKVCDEWSNSFENFRDWAMKNGYDDSLTIERIDVNGNYCPENCKWITKADQAKNTRWCMMISYNGKTQNLSDWCKELRLDYKRVHNRMKTLGWSFERAITEPVNVKKRNMKTRQSKNLK